MKKDTLLNKLQEYADATVECVKDYNIIKDDKDWNDDNEFVEWHKEMAISYLERLNKVVDKLLK